VSGIFLGPQLEKVTVEELLDGVLLDYCTNGKAVRFARAAIEYHLRPYFRRRRAVAVTTEAVKKYVAFRRSADQGTRPYRGRLDVVKQIPIKPAENATINRELALLKHAFHLGWKSTPRRAASVPYIPLLEEHNVRKGFFEHDQFLALRSALPEYLRPVLTFAYYTGCRRGESLALEWPQVDLVARVVRLEPGTTKKRRGARLAADDGTLRGSLDAAVHPGYEVAGLPVGVLQRGGRSDRPFPALLENGL
jgi:integrase